MGLFDDLIPGASPRLTRGSTFGDQNGPGTDSGDNGQFAYGGSSVNDTEDYAALPTGSGVPPGYKFPVLNPQTGDVVWVTHRDKGPAKWTGRGVDLAPSAMQKLGATTDDPLVVDTGKAFNPQRPFDDLIPKGSPDANSEPPADKPDLAGNIDLNNRPVVHNPDGSISTVKTIGVNRDGKEYVIPTISDDGRVMSNGEATKQFKKSGKFFGAFDTVDAANAFAQRLHESQARQYADAPTYAPQEASPKPEGSVFTDPQARADLVANVKQGLKDFIPTLKQGVATIVPHNREELVSALQDVTQKAAAPYEESMYRTAGPEKYDQPSIDLADPYAMVPGLPPGLIPELAKIKGPVGDYIRSQVEASPKHEPSGYERFGQAALGAASQLTTPHSAADIYSFKTPGAQRAFQAERILSVPEQIQKAKDVYDQQGLPEALASAANDAAMTVLPSLHDAGKLKDAGQYGMSELQYALWKRRMQQGDAGAIAERTQGAGQQISPEHLQAIAQELQRRDTGLPNLEGEAGSPNRRLEDTIEKALRRTTLTPLRSATDLALIRTNKNPVPQLDEKSNDASISSDAQRPSEVPFNPQKEPAQGAETDLAPAGMEDKGAVERQGQTPVRDAASMETSRQPEGGAEAGQATGAEDIRGQINTETGRAERGLDPREEVLRREFGKSVELAQKKEANNPGAGRRLVERLEKSPKAVNDVDHVLLAQQVVQAQNEYKQATEESLANPGDPEAQHAVDIADARVQKAYEAYDNGGTGTARGLAIRNVLKAHDYTLPAMEARLRAKALGGAELPYKYKTELKGIHERMAAADETLGKAYAGLDPEDLKKLRPEVGPITRDINQNLNQVVTIDGKRLQVSVSPKGSISFGAEPGLAVATLARTNLGAFKTMNRIAPIITRLVKEKLRENPNQEFIFDSPPEKTALYQRYLKDAGIDARPSIPFKIPQDHPLREGMQSETKLYAGLPMPEPKKDRRDIGRDITRITADTKDYQKRTEAKDITPRKPKGEPLMSAEKQKALYEREKAKADYHSMIERVKYEQRGKLYRGTAQLASLPRRAAVYGHGIVFPVTHAGDLLLRYTSWGTFGKGFLRTYAANFSPEFHKAIMGRMMDTKFKNGENAYHLAVASKVDVGLDTLGSGLVKKHGMAARSWDALKVMRFELWKNSMERQLRKHPNMSYAEKLELGKQVGTWANHATGSGKGIFADSGLKYLEFGPKLTQSKINRLTIDPAKTIATFYKMATGGETTLGERVAARTRLSGAAQYATALAGFLYANQAILNLMGSKQKINLTDPNKTDFWSFKIAGTDIAIPGMHSEMRYLAQILATVFASRKELRGEPRQSAIFSKLAQYGRSKLSPTAQLVAEGATRQDYRGRPLPFSNEKPTKFLPKYSITEYAASKAPIPLTGPGKYVFDQMRDKGMSPLEAAETTQALTIFGLGLTGMHVHEDYPEKPKKGH